MKREIDKTIRNMFKISDNDIFMKNGIIENIPTIKELPINFNCVVNCNGLNITADCNICNRLKQNKTPKPCVMCLFVNNSSKTCCVQNKQNFSRGIIDCYNNGYKKSIKFGHNFLGNLSGTNHKEESKKYNTDYYVAITTDLNPNNKKTPNRLMHLAKSAAQIDIHENPIQISAKLMCQPNSFVLHFFICEL